MTTNMNINKSDHNFYRFDLKGIAKKFEGNLTYTNTFCVKNAYLPVAVFHNTTPDRSKNHKDYLLVWIQVGYTKQGIPIISGMDADEIEEYRYQNGLYCPDCKEVIYSVYRHDYRKCKCDRCMVDGGKDYFRTNMEGLMVKIDLLTDDIELINEVA